MLVSYYPVKHKGKAADIEFTEFLSGVKTGRWDVQVREARALYPGKGYDQAKLSMPSVAASGVFATSYYVNDEQGKAVSDEHGQHKFCTGRTLKDLQAHSGIIYLDIDRKKNPGMDVAELRSRIQADSYTYACHLSLSGDGLAVAFRVPTEDPYGSFRALAAYYKKRFAVVVDGLPDPTRLRFVTSDPDLYLHEQAPTFEETLEEAKPTPRAYPAGQPYTTTDQGYGAAMLNTAVKRVLAAADGEKRTVLNKAALTLGGVVGSGFLSEDEAYYALEQAILSHPLNNEAHALKTIRIALCDGAKKPLLPSPLQRQVREQQRAEVPREAIIQFLSANAGIAPEKLTVAIDAVLDEPNPALLTFWRVVYKEGTKTSQDTYKLQIDRTKFREWLSMQGFSFRPAGAGGAVEFLRTEHNIVRTVERYHLKQYVLDFVEQLPPRFDSVSRDELDEALMIQIKSLFDKETLDCLPQLTTPLLRDTRTTARFFFRNGWVEVTAQGVTVRPYAELPGLINQNQVHSFDFRLLYDLEAMQCDFHAFMRNVTGQDPTRLAQLQRALGYLLHAYKDVTNARCVIFMDAIGEVGISSGGTGKGLLMQAVAQLVEVAQLDGEMFDLRDPFRYEEVTDTARVVFFDEWKATRNPFTALFSTLTGGLPINRKYQAKKTLAFAEAPKFAIATNEVVTGDDDSSTRRKVEIALAKCYSATYTPRDEFGTGFFGEHWDTIEYNRFFNLAMLWVQQYLMHGLLLLKDENIAARGLMQEVGATFHEFASDLLEQTKRPAEEGEEPKAPLWLADTYEAYQKATGDKRTGAQVFSKKMVQFGFEKVKNLGRLYGDSRRFQWHYTLPTEPPAGFL
ncbi:hypothetical protein BEN47_05075 [Hymenobacter lapidarius]|uniref:BT4734-like N-terminal domain-containing protein n=1 Tax=Hymenobacter lapidarius TaxID=1908237 RepID=A0A1G1STN2_9BACT|nr:BT4734/BF3469 family protein [Hymenobacter lapidarius]OGX81994.1 hypothetical protein BEN47_05075 [Hymenobacter lapidarius]